uniref:Protoheme IX farnesyltransferase n=1 Tax=Paulinella chromatophora TaxID=39717 RepID=B1X5E4_PAUCH|nr:putative protoheme IX farnesyltransferase [Paulinella chromatophora]ACB43163.1 putative protoheme IX farnesyltransferase [Paulinella chromatophora]|eukprot:gb/GEZN01000116.1/.p2 GENE.gb/GEZN01000116.1/~~gb/GEZN01000116.1/.p2  ORF type:complete len:326 (+),score=-7.78 gb/GEZN01000116.1/:3849-4826(+)
MVSSSTSVTLSREEVIPSRRIVKLPPWLEIAKPRLIPLLLATTLGGMALSEGWPLSYTQVASTLIGGALAAAAAGALNCLWEQELDGRMQRTSNRALPSGKLSPISAFLGASICSTSALIILVNGANPLAAALAFLGICSYVLLYTILLKPRTTQNIVIGGVAGAIPPLVGTAVGGHVGLGGWWLFTLIMAWTPAHFWSLGLLLKEDYKSVGIPMLPVVKGPAVTAKAITLYGWITVLLSGLGVMVLPEGGIFYGLLLLPFNGRLLQMVYLIGQTPSNLDYAKRLFRYSILYLFGICFLLLASRSPQAASFSQQTLHLLILNRTS